MICGACSFENEDGAKFCIKCGRANKKSCPACGSDAESKAKFCLKCGHNFSIVDAFSESWKGIVNNGEWHRGGEEFIRKVEYSEMKKLFPDSGFFGKIFNSFAKKTIKVPVDSVCVVLENGSVKELLPPGYQTTKGWLEMFLNEETSTKQFYLISRRPVPVLSSMEIGVGTHVQKIDISVNAFVPTDKESIPSLEKFLRYTVSEKNSMSYRDLHILIKKEISQYVFAAMDKTNSSLEEAERLVQSRLRSQIGEKTGLVFDLEMLLAGTKVSLNLLLGRNEIPDLKSCISNSCNAEVRTGMKYCLTCGIGQPMSHQTSEKEGEALPLITKDGEHTELDLVLSLFGDGRVTDAGISEIVKGIASCAARIIRQENYESLPSAFENIEKEASKHIAVVVEKMGLSIKDVGVLDFRSKRRHWEMNTRAEIEQVKSELQLNREWLEVDREQLDIQSLSLDMVRKQKKLQINHELLLFKERRSIELETLRFEREADLQQADIETSHRENMQDQYSRHANVDILENKRENEKAREIDRENRQTARDMTQEDHIDTIQEMQNTQAYQQKEQEFVHQSEAQQLSHEQRLESHTVDHDLEQQQKIAKRQRQEMLENAKNQSSIDEIEQESFFKSESLQQDLFERKEQFSHDLSQQAMQLQLDRDEQSKSNEHQRDMEELKAAQEHIMNIHKMDVGLEEKRVDADVQKSTHASVIEAQIAAERERSVREQMAMMEKINQQSSSRIDNQTDKMFAMMQTMTQQMTQQNQAMAAGLSNQSARAENAYKEQAIQAKEMSQTSMESMSNVAASRAQSYPPPGHHPSNHYQQPINQPPSGAPPESPQVQSQPDLAPKSFSPPPTTKSCVSCGFQLPMEAMFCPECGTSQ